MTPADLIFADELEAGAVLDIEVTVPKPWLLEGWASAAKPRTFAYIAGRAESGPILSYAIANRYNADAFEKNIGYGWCGFSIDLTRIWPQVRGATLIFSCMKSAKPIFDYDVPDVAIPRSADERSKLGIRDFVLRGRQDRAAMSIFQLELIVAAFITKRGPREFVQRAHFYIFGREADPEEQRKLTEQVENGRSGCDVLNDLIASGEYRSTPRSPLALPGDAAFPFYAE